MSRQRAKKSSPSYHKQREPEDHEKQTTKRADMILCSFQPLPCLIAQGSGKDYRYRALSLQHACLHLHLLLTFFFIVDMRLRMSSISGSGAFEDVAQICWFGQPSQALDLPASAEAVPGQFSGASSGGLLMDAAEN
jgi:hypothetical protein